MKVLNPKTVADLAREGRTPGADLGLTELLEQEKQFMVCPKTILGANTRRGKCLHWDRLIGNLATVGEPICKRLLNSSTVVHFVVPMPTVGLWMRLIL